MKLSDYFQPLNSKNIIIFLLIIMFFDILGSFVKNFITKSKKISIDTRIINWLIGFGTFIFFWFIAGFFIRPTQIALLGSVIIILTITLPSYVRNKEYINLFNTLKISLPFILIIVPFLPALFVKSSLPPYYSDEMAYHFISPYTANYQLAGVWKFDGGVLNNAPRLIDTFFVLGFSLTKTYSIVRLTLFTILATSIIFVSYILRKKISYVIGIFFTLLFFSLPQDIIFTSTVGFVDISSYAFFILGLIFSSIIVIERKEKFEWFKFAMIFLAMSVGTKYTILTAFIPLIILLFVFNFKHIKTMSIKIMFYNSLYILLLFIVFGGYWYFKNLIIYGNPIYPFLFPCWGKYAVDCNTGASFFGDWTTRVDLTNIQSIILSLVPGGKTIVLMTLLSIFPLFIRKYASEKRLILFYILIFVFELLSLKFMSGFYIRYHQHMQILLLLSVTISVYVFSKIKLSIFIKFVISMLFLVPIVHNYFFVIKKTNSLESVSWNEINYSTGKDTIYDWIKFRLPKVYESIVWCENPLDGPISLGRYDPDMIWYDDDGYMRSFLVNCYYGGQTLDTTTFNTIKLSAIEKKVEFYTVSANKCVKDSEVKSKRKEEGTIELKMRHDNNYIICNSKEILPNFYYFSYKNLNEE